MTKIIVTGNIGNSAELRTVKTDGDEFAVCDFWVASNRKFKDGREKTTWYKVTLWREFASTMAKYLTKGRKVQVIGTPEPTYYVRKKDNAIIPYVDIRDVELELLDAKKEDAPAEEALPFPEDQ